jgi:urease accessory protein
MPDTAVPRAIRWRVLQIADSAFPAGGFAHSAGLEAAVHHGEARTAERLEAFVAAHLWNAGHAGLPFVAAAHGAPRAVWELDAEQDALLTNHVANRASRTQGRAFIATCERVFDEAALSPLALAARARHAPSHIAPLFGAALGVLGIDRDETLGIFMHLSLRGVVSAAVRLGVVGPLEAQRLSARLAPTLDGVLAACSTLHPDSAASTAPVADIYPPTHDRLYARLFQS